MRLPVFVRLWFAVDLVLALAPPLHWAATGPTRVLAYLLGTSAFIAASVVAAYAAEMRSRG